MTACRRSMARRSFPTTWTNGSGSLKPRSSASARAKRHAYDPDEIARGGPCRAVAGRRSPHRAWFHPSRGREARSEEAGDGETVIDGVRVNGDGEIIEDGDDAAAHNADDEDGGDDGTPLSDLLVRELTTHRTLRACGSPLASSRTWPDPPSPMLLPRRASIGGGDAICLDIRTVSPPLGGHADGIEDTGQAAKALADRHAGWAADTLRDVADLCGASSPGWTMQASWRCSRIAPRRPLTR